MILAHLRGEVEIGAEEGAAKFGHQLLHGVTGIAPLLAPQIAIEPGFMARPVGAFMRQRGVVAFGIAERLERGHLHEVGADIVIGHIAAVADIGFGGGKERLGAFDPLHRIEPWLGDCMEMRGQAFDLLDIEHGIGFEERDRRSVSSPVS